MIVFGGVTREKQIKGDLWVYQPEDNTWMEAHPTAGAARPLPRQGHCAAAVGNMMYIFGGVSYGYQPFNDFWAYNVVTNEWTELSPNQPFKGPAPRWLSSCTIVEDGPDSVRFFLFGGVGKEQVPMNDLHVFDIANNAWSQPTVSEGFAPFPRMMHNMVWMGSRIFVFGGLANNIPFEDLHYYDLKTGMWSEVLPSGAFFFACGGAFVCKLQPVKAAVPDRPNYKNFDINNRPNARWEPRYRKTWNQNNFMVIFGGVGVVQG
jgi:N-acetylneuraminic acid mutarotase